MVDAIDSKSILGCQGAGSSPVIGKLVLFDFDGLLVDTEKLHYLAYQEALQKWGCPLDINFETYISLAHHESGKGLKDYIERTFPTLSGKWSEVRGDKLIIYSHLVQTNIELMPFVSVLLISLTEKNIPSCVVTNSLKKDVDAIKSHHPTLNLIPHWITRENYEKPKPQPDGYLTALKLFPEIAPSDALGLEDTLKGIHALQAASIPAILICDSHHPQLAHAKNIPFLPSLQSLIT